jgi:hypothetical protein
MTRKGKRIDFFFGNEKHHLVSALTQDFGHGNPGKEMPACSSACNDRVHGM